MKQLIQLLLCLSLTLSLAYGEDSSGEMVDTEDDIDLKSVTILDQEMKGPEEPLGQKIKKEKVPVPATLPKLPSTEERDQLFEDSGLRSEISGLDALDRDIFYRRSIETSGPEFLKLYPQISREKLPRFQALTRVR